MNKDTLKEEELAPVFDFLEYNRANEVCRDFPELIKAYDKLLPTLYEHSAYHGVWIVLAAVEDGRRLLNLQLDFYRKVLAKKGKKDE